MSDTTAPKLTLSAWQRGLEAFDPSLAAQLTENANPYAVAAEMGLPTPSYVLFPTVSAFLEDPAKGIKSLTDQGITNFYAGARTSAPGLHNFRNESGPEPAGNLVRFLQERIGPGDYDKYNLRIAEFLAGIAVVAIVDTQGTIDLDLAVGTADKPATLPPLTSGLVTPDFRASNVASKDNPFGQLQYFSKDDSQNWSDRPLPPADDLPLSRGVRAAIRRALAAIAGRPGSYEFAVVDHHGLQVPIFADALPNDGSRNRAFSLPQDQDWW